MTLQFGDGKSGKEGHFEPLFRRKIAAFMADYPYIYR